MATAKKGDIVRQILPAPIEGEVVDKTFNADTDSFTVIVEFDGADGEKHQRAFDTAQVEVITPRATE